MNAWFRIGVIGAWIIAATGHAAERPAFQPVRYNEDAAAWRNVEPRTTLDHIKHIPLGDSESAFLSLGGQARVRWEYWDHFLFDPDASDDFLLFRLRLHGDLHVGDHLRVFVEGKMAEATRRDLPGGRRTLDVDTADLQNAFVDLSTAPAARSATLRAGRQELLYGAQRLISPLDWANTRRTFDGGRALFKHEHGQLDAFAVRPVVVDKYRFNETDSDQWFYGAYATQSVPGTPLKADLYLLRLDRDELPLGDEERYTAGARVTGRCPLTGINLDVEGGHQFGEQGDADISAWFIAALASHTFNDLPLRPRVHAGYDYASGDSNPEDAKLRTFHQLFPLGHAYLGYIDLLGRQNIHAWHTGITLQPWKAVDCRIDYHVFQRAERADAVYNVGGGVWREGDPAASRDIGSELDITVNWRVDARTIVSLGYHRFYPGTFVKQTGPSEPIDFVYTSAQWTF